MKKNEEVLREPEQKFPCKAVEKTMPEQEKSERRKERQRGTVLDRPQPPLPIFLCCSEKGEEVEEPRVKLSLRKGGGEGAILIFCLCFRFPNSVLTGNKLNYFSPSLGIPMFSP